MNPRASTGGKSLSPPEMFLHRVTYQGDRTLGWITVRRGAMQLFNCASLELPWKNNDDQLSCVPAGDYVIELEYSPKFKMELWELRDVPGRDEVKLHSANYPHQFLGCIAPAMYHSDIDKDGRLDAAESRKARDEIHAAMGDFRKSVIHISGDGRDVLKKGMNGYR